MGAGFSKCMHPPTPREPPTPGVENASSGSQPPLQSKLADTDSFFVFPEAQSSGVAILMGQQSRLHTEQHEEDACSASEKQEPAQKAEQDQQNEQKEPEEGKREEDVAQDSLPEKRADLEVAQLGGEPQKEEQMQPPPTLESLKLYDTQDSLRGSKLLSSGSVTDEYLFKTEAYTGLKAKWSPKPLTEIHAAVMDFGRHSVKFGCDFSPFVEPFVSGRAKDQSLDYIQEKAAYGSKAARGGAIYNLEWPCGDAEGFLSHLLEQEVVRNENLVLMGSSSQPLLGLLSKALESGQFKSVAVVNQLEMSLLNSGFVSASVVNSGAFLQGAVVFEGRVLPLTRAEDACFGGVPFQAQLSQALGMKISQVTADKIAQDFSEAVKRQETEGQDVQIELPDGTALSPQQLETIYDATKAAKEAADRLLNAVVDKVQEQELKQVVLQNVWLTGGFQPAGGPGQLQNYLGGLILAETAEFYFPRAVTMADLQEHGPELIARFYLE